MRLTLEIVVKCLFSSDVSDDVDEVGATLKELVKPFASQATLGWILNNRLPTPAHIRFHRLAKKIDLKSRPDRGIVATDIQARNQKGEIVFAVTTQILAERREPYRPT